ncbi:uncharacterized protein LOC123557598 [Mercenaria mercenaria]|uniref:uncharacterized protein LOC123557598 n=1 Tax=Mercenaria mercenaria TaxID=6596 RepID=UPI00234F52A5|nr:uncharacterized protein LOC123557598 [Mercenaria mercenaria]XP_053399895.1 uncharacterized protein LOC123557598 [Mercenaria mercenaria]XP_053399896.1 uncharacterized protein LOC123557598 [Mercenaria mercenaria]XP_053399897.1 uncharacterized protein LOC123557598 [Mercenaria mercenaria]XP_053399898.1 uncharacterized protein LOC123557598 [Mercenaria mercenaria]XP_053399899.1 uncharacterized protein LOC123557598 [Mercenaria mercenaria]XP_053399901.1 uncharacterized protein LOC123557598 [Mercen
MTHIFYFNMSSNLKRTKFYFLIIAILSFVIILVSYNWNITENIYRISSEISQVRIAKLQSPDIRITESPDVRMTERTLANFHEDATRTLTADHIRKTKMRSETGKESGEENDYLKLKSTIHVHKRNETIIKKKYVETMEDSVKDIRPDSNRNSTFTQIIVFDNDDLRTKNSSETSEAGRQVDVSQTKNETAKPSNSVIHDNQKLISESVVQNTLSNETDFNFEKFKNSKEETRQVLNKIHKLKEELTGDHKSSTVIHSKKTRVTRPKHHVTRIKDNGQLPTERDINTFKRIKSRLQNLGLINSAFLMPHNHQDTHNSYNLDSDVTSRPDVCAGCFEKNFRKIINEPNLCDGDVELLFMIASTVARKDSRNAIRKTWCGGCNKPDSKMKLVFVFGNRHDSDENENLLEESEEFHDIIQMDFVDTYANLTYKTMSSLLWSEDYCKQAKYVMKTDDDMYINTELLPLLLKAAPSEKFIGGMCWGPSSPHRDSNSKWYVSFVQYRHSLFPSMCSGTGYVMSRDVVSGVLRQSPNVPFFYLEDVYVAICVKKLGIHPVLLDGFKNTRVDFDPCTYRNQIITAHELNADVLDYVWTESRTCPKVDLTPEMVYRPIPV